MNLESLVNISAAYINQLISIYLEHTIRKLFSKYYLKATT